MILRLDLSTARRVFVVGDIHGNFSKLLKQLEEDHEFDPTRGDILLCVGDLVDRGPESHLALRWLDKKWFKCVAGNHEIMHTEARWARALDNPQNGGLWVHDVPIEEYRDFQKRFLELPIVIEAITPTGKKIGLVHAGYPAEDWDDVDLVVRSNANHMLWDRTYISMALNGELPESNKGVKNVDAVYYGHTPLRQPFSRHNEHWIDTGGYREGQRYTIVEVT